MYVNMYLSMQICNKSRTILEKLSQSPCVIISNKWHVFFFGGGGGGGFFSYLSVLIENYWLRPWKDFLML